MFRIFIAAVAIAASSPFFVQAHAQTPGAELSTWKIDVSHSELTFTIRHLVSRVRGEFREWSGTIMANTDDWSTAKVDISINANTIDTNHSRRDDDLRSPNHFDVVQFPTITFTSSKVERSGENIRLTGDLTLHGVTRPVVLAGKFLGMTGPAGKKRAGFEAETTINRLDYGVKWNRVVEDGNLLGDEVRIHISVAAVQQQPIPKPAP